MKKITLLCMAIIASWGLSAQEMILSHSTDALNFGGGVACANTDSGISTTNSFWRSYVLADFDITEATNVVKVEVAVGSANGATAASFVTVNLYTSDGAFPGGTRTLIASQELNFEESDANTLKILTLDAPIGVEASDEIVIEVFDADETVNFRIGQNTSGETAPSYLSSDGCGITDPTATEDIGGGFPDDYVLNLVVDATLGVDDNLLSQVAVYPNPTSNELNVKVPASVEIMDAAIYDVLGKKVNAQLVGGKMNTADLSAGVYILKVTTSAGTLTEKIVKQ